MIKKRKYKENDDKVKETYHDADEKKKSRKTEEGDVFHLS